MLPHRNPLLASAKSITSVSVEYTARGRRVSKSFIGPAALPRSRAFYNAKLKAGADPRIVAANRAHP